MRTDVEKGVWKFLARHLKSRQPVALLVVAESIGSSPGRAGFKMAVDAEGSLCGSIGGGIMEIKLVELAKSRLQRSIREPLLKRQIHRKDESGDQSGMICSGEQSVIFLQPEFGDLPVVRAAIRCLKQGKPALLQINEQGFRVLQDRKNEQTFRFERHPNQTFLFEENLGAKHHLYLIGGGHCALALSELMSKLDFHITLFDDRADLNTFAKNRFVHKKLQIDHYENIGDWVPSGNEVYVVVMTVGYRTDAVVIRQLLYKNFRYFGVLGSAAKMTTLLDQLRREGFPETQLARIRTPIGLRINSRTPEEIAVSIAGELIQVKNT
ncbi:MAG: XdhC family protein [Saprospiraceae bacterium]|nr:XdhC family protein [Saprospiraceae bacterium]